MFATVSPSRPSRPTSYDLLRARLAEALNAGLQLDATTPPVYLQYANDPVGFARDILGVQLWSKQRQIAESVRDHRRTTVRSCHESGKTFTAAVLVPWWVLTRTGAFVVTTARTQRQVKIVLWREINRLHRRSRLPGRLNMTEWHLGGEVVAFGQKPSDFDPTAFQGIHAEAVLVLVDEACGVPDTILTAAKTLVGNDASRLCLFGNPDDPATAFFQSHLPGSGFNAIRIAAAETPNFTGEPVSDVARRSLLSPQAVQEHIEQDGWLPGTPIYRSKIEGEFPDQSEDTLVPMAWIRNAQDLWRETRDVEPSRDDRVGVDVGGGVAETTFGLLRGVRFRIVQAWTEPDTMVSSGRIQNLLDSQAHLARTHVDVVGIGKGLSDRLKELSKGRKPSVREKWESVGVNVGEACRRLDEKKRYQNLRSKFWWGLRTRFQSGTVAIDPADHLLASQLANMRWWPDSAGRIVIESKIDMRKRGLPSPDRADTLMLAAADVPRLDGATMLPVTWN